MMVLFPDPGLPVRRRFFISFYKTQDEKGMSRSSASSASSETNRRRIVGCILGILGGLFGIIGALGGFVTYMVGESGLIPEKYVSLLVPKHIVFPALGVLFALLGIVAGAASIEDPETAGKLMIVSAVGGTGTALLLYAPAALLLLAGGYFSLTHRGKPSWCIL